MLGHRLRRWPNIKPTLFQCIVFAGLSLILKTSGEINYRATGLNYTAIIQCQAAVTAHLLS